MEPVTMTLRQYQERQRQIYADWNKRYADRIPSAYPADSNPHVGQATDYAEHHAIMSAPEEYTGLLYDRLAELDREWNAPENTANRQEANNGRS